MASPRGRAGPQDNPPSGEGSNDDLCAGCGRTNLNLLVCDDPSGQNNTPWGRQRFCANCMIGKKVRVFWPLDEHWYIGIVQRFDPNTGEHLLTYPDGDTEWVKIGESNTTGIGALTGAGGSAPVRGGGIPNDVNGGVSQPTMQQHPGMRGMGDDRISPDKGQRGGGSFDQGLGGAGPPSPDNRGGSPSQANQARGGAPPQPIYGGGHPGMYQQGPPMGYGMGPGPYPGMHHPGQGYGPPPGQYPGPPPPYPYHPHQSHMMGGIPPGGGAPGRKASSPTNVPDSQATSDGKDPVDGGSKRKSGPKTWTKEEDALLLNMVQSMRMPMKWSIVAQSMPERTGKQCRERYVNHLNPRLKITEWSPSEDATIFHLYDSAGSQWAKMSKMIPGRTDNGIKNRFHNLRRQLEREDEHRLRLSKPQDFPDEIRIDRIREFPENLKGKSDELWEMTKGIGVLAAQSVLGGGIARNAGRFGPFRGPTDPNQGEQCARCGLMVPSVHCGTEICTKTRWCLTCTRLPPHVSGSLLRECLNLRRCQDGEKRKILEAWDGKVDDNATYDSAKSEEETKSEENAPIAMET
eukprot:CAMPEP_0198296488 /NCGR_PEP_ID=MMETSP1449-20131203/32773_1 /TAXON_ID=420275 /ORGANISM="Attheya septentrionalis, Strain CCMP2084" /LENGTH=574 /DNA_ID=CAMNT_0043997127 /DNA_START=10 /DNA_END=1734 /DNA_ORIENTATION=-